MKKDIYYNYFTTINGFRIYKKLLDDKFMLEYHENGKIVSIFFYSDGHPDPIIPLVYKNGKNYRTYRFIKKYAENNEIMNTIKLFLFGPTMDKYL